MRQVAAAEARDRRLALLGLLGWSLLGGLLLLGAAAGVITVISARALAGLAASLPGVM